jgi:putative transposase
MTDTSMVARKRDDDPPPRPPLVDEQLADQLLGKAQAEEVELLGPDGLLSQVTKAVLERALAEEMTGHLGYDKNDPAGRGSGNSRNGTTGKTVLTDIGAVDLAVPRDRNGSFEPQIVRKGQTRLDGFNERIIALYARGMTTRDIRAHLREMYGVDVSPDLISRVTDAVVEELAEWQSRPLDRVYPVVFVDALMVKIRDGVVTNRAVYLAIGIDCEGAKQVLGLWVGPTTGESAKFWLSVLSELKGRGVADVCIVCCDGLTGLPEAISVTWPQATVQLCVVHRSRQEIRCCLSGSGTMVCYADTGRCRRSACPEIRGLTASSGRASAAVGAGDRGPAARAWRGTPGRAARRGQRDHRPQGRIRTRRRCRAVIRGAGAASGWRPDAGRGR